MVVVVEVVEEGEGGEKVRDKSNHMVANSRQTFPQKIAETEQLHPAKRMIRGIGNMLLTTDSQ